MSKLEVQGLSVQFGWGRSALTAVDQVDLAVPERGTLGLVGESGSGKSSVGKAIVGLAATTAGRILLDGEDYAGARGRRLKRLRRDVQLIFQDPYSSLNPRLPVGEAVVEAARLQQKRRGSQRELEVARLFELVGLAPALRGRYPHQLSGGQRQRVALARALAVGAKVLILDEVTSALDVSVQANILNLLRDLQSSLGLSYLFISHNLGIVRYMSDLVAVMYLGRIVESAPTTELFGRPEHPYTGALIESIPRLSESGTASEPVLEGEMPDPRNPPSGCRFRTRCPIGPKAHPERTICVSDDPQLHSARDQHLVACHFPLHQVPAPEEKHVEYSS